jgi:hypothetical protein
LRAARSLSLHTCSLLAHASKSRKGSEVRCTAAPQESSGASYPQKERAHFFRIDATRSHPRKGRLRNATIIGLRRAPSRQRPHRSTSRPGRVDATRTFGISSPSNAICQLVTGTGLCIPSHTRAGWDTVVIAELEGRGGRVSTSLITLHGGCALISVTRPRP